MTFLDKTRTKTDTVFYATEEIQQRYYQYTQKIQEDTSSPNIIVHIMYTVLLLPLELGI